MPDGISQECIVPFSLVYRGNSYILLEEALRLIEAKKVNQNFSGGRADYTCDAEGLTAALTKLYAVSVDSSTKET